MKVKLTYFRTSGKYYSEAEYESQLTPLQGLFLVWEEVERKSDARRLPGLMEGHSHYFVLIDVPEHPHRHLHLLVD